jgi:methionyl-tRNA formyltransferase
MAAPWRVVILTAIPPVARSYAAIVRACGHDPAAVVVPRTVRGPFAEDHVDNDPAELDIVFAASKESLPRIFRAYEADLVVCTGFPWRIQQEAIDAAGLGIVNGHPSLLPRYRGPFPVAWAVRNGETEVGMSYHLMDTELDTGNLLAQKRISLDPEETWESLAPRLEQASIELLPQVFERLARGDRGDAQSGGDYQSQFEQEFALVDTAQTAAEVHRQARAWSFVPPFARFGPVLERNGTKVLLTQTSLAEVAGADRLDCADGPLWIVETTDL